MGPTGTGKTRSIGTLVDYGARAGFEVFLMALESGYSTLFGYWADRGLPIPDNFHHHHIQFAEGTAMLDALTAKVKIIGDTQQESLYKITDGTRGNRNYVHTMLRAMADFECQRTGKKYGNVSKWGTNRVFVLDGLTGLGRMAMALVVGNKPVRSQADWGIAQDIVEPIIWQLCDGFRCHFVLLAHVERETDAVSGASKVMVQSLGRALPPKLPPMFDDAILSVRNGTTWTWSTANPTADLKTRHLTVADGIEPNFAAIYQKWESRGGRYVS